MSMCNICGGWDCEFCNPFDLISSLRIARENGTEVALVQKLIENFEKKQTECRHGEMRCLTCKATIPIEFMFCKREKKGKAELEG